MQLFVLDPDPEVCAQYMSDKHVRAMCVEYAHALTSNDKTDPVVKWVRYSVENYDWMMNLLYWVNMEYRWRFRKGNHRVAERVLLDPRKPDLPSLGFTVPPVMVPRRYFDEDPILAYRRYYYARKRGQCQWSKRPVPWFMQEKLSAQELAA